MEPTGTLRTTPRDLTELNSGPRRWTFQPDDTMRTVETACHRCRTIWTLGPDDLHYGVHTNYAGDSSGGLFATCSRCGAVLVVEYYDDYPGRPSAGIAARQGSTTAPSNWTLNSAIPHAVRDAAWSDHRRGHALEQASVQVADTLSDVLVQCDRCQVTWRVNRDDAFVYEARNSGTCNAGGRLVLPCRRCGHRIEVESYRGPGDPAGSVGRHGDQILGFRLVRADIPNRVRTAAWRRWAGAPAN